MLDVIPAPLHVTPEAGELCLRPGARVACSDATLVPIVERFCHDVSRRLAMPVLPAHAGAAAEVRVELGSGRDLAALPKPIGISPVGNTVPDERYELSIDCDRVVIRAFEPVGVARGLMTLLQLMATTPQATDAGVLLPAVRILDAPRFAWRGFSLDLARTFFGLRDVKRVVELLALYKFNVLHLHLTDDQGWRLPTGRPANGGGPEGTYYTVAELRELVRFATDRFVTLVPEVDTPGHASALLDLHPELDSGRNQLSLELAPGEPMYSTWLDPHLPATFEVLEHVFADVATIFPGPFINIGGDEAFGMSEELYVDYIRRVRTLVRAIGKRTMGWQESIRAGADPDHVIQYWISTPTLGVTSAMSPELRAAIETNMMRAREDIAQAIANAVPIIVSPVGHCYFDVPYGESSIDPVEDILRRKMGPPFVTARTVAETFDWDPVSSLGPQARPGDVGGVGAAIWAETIHSFDELTFMLLPRLAGAAEKAWSEPRVAPWPTHRDHLAHHARIWAQDGLTYFHSSTVDWPHAA